MAENDSILHDVSAETHKETAGKTRPFLIIGIITVAIIALYLRAKSNQQAAAQQAAAQSGQQPVGNIIGTTSGSASQADLASASGGLADLIGNTSIALAQGIQGDFNGVASRLNTQFTSVAQQINAQRNDIQGQSATLNKIYTAINASYGANQKQEANIFHFLLGAMSGVSCITVPDPNTQSREIANPSGACLASKAGIDGIYVSENPNPAEINNIIQQYKTLYASCNKGGHYDFGCVGQAIATRYGGG